MTILIVDDSQTVRDVLRTLLRARGYKIMEAGDGDQALAMAQQQPIDLLLTDVVMPNMGGGELAQALSALQPELPVLFISGFPFDLAPHRDRLARGAFLKKPFDFDQLFQVVEELTKK